MKKLAYIFLVLLPFALAAQEEDASRFSKFDFGFTGSPDYSYRFLTSDASNQWIVDGYDSLEFSKVGYTLGVSGSYDFNSKFSLSLGVAFSDKGDKTKKELVPSLNNYTNHYYYLDIPIRINYYFVDKKIKLYSSLGISPSVFINHVIVTKLGSSSNDIRIVDNSTLSTINIAAQAGLGFDVQLTDKWYFKMECLYKQSLQSISNKTPVKKYLYSLAPTFGFFVHL